MLIWITGISGSGKSTLGKFIYKKIKKKFHSTIFIDGDQFRKVFQNDLGYSLEDRNINAKRLIFFAKYFLDQKINIIVAANITSSKYRKWCRRCIKNYFEIFIDTPISILKKRDYKNLYKDALRGKIKNVVGVDIPFVKPKNPDMIISNFKSKKELYSNFEKILNNIKKKNLKFTRI